MPKLDAAGIAEIRGHVSDWDVHEERELRRAYRFKNFVALMEFVNRMAALAEEQRHHPDFSVHYNELDVKIWTHAVGGLSENDFILATKIDSLDRG